VLVVYDPALVAFDALLQVFWESHDPTQGMRQGNDCRHAVPVGDPLRHAGAIRCRAGQSRRYSNACVLPGHGEITTEIRFPAPVFYYAEDEHQQYLSKNRRVIAGLGGHPA
jgi:peptide-methionine (S)-S-oxide reductase